MRIEIQKNEMLKITEGDKTTFQSFKRFTSSPEWVEFCGEFYKKLNKELLKQFIKWKSERVK